MSIEVSSNRKCKPQDGGSSPFENSQMRRCFRLNWSRNGGKKFRVRLKVLSSRFFVAPQFQAQRWRRLPARCQEDSAILSRHEFGSQLASSSLRLQSRLVDHCLSETRERV